MSQIKQQDKSFLDVIFKFIFQGVQKDVKTSAPRDVPKTSSDNMARGLEEVAKRPGIHANGEALASVAQALNTPSGSEKSAKVEKTAAKNLNLIRVPGTVTDQGVGAVVAKVAGASSEDAVKIGAVLGNDTMPRSERDSQARVMTARTSAFDIARERKLGYDDANKLSQTFSSILESSNIDLNAIKTSSEKIKVQRILGKKLKGFGLDDQSRVNELLEKYIAKAEDASKGLTSKGNWSLGALDKGFTNEPEKPSAKLLAIKLQELDSQDRFLGSLGIDEKDFRRKNLAQEMKLLKLWQMSDGSDMRLSKYWGTMYKNMSAFNAMSLEGKVFGGIINGDAFDSKKNGFAPAERRKLVINGMEFGNMLVPKDEADPIDASLASYYYRTPPSIARTLFSNGEGFVYSAYKKQAKIREIISGSESLYNFIENYQSDDLKQLLEGIEISNNQQQVLQALTSENKYIQLIKILERNKSTVLTDPNLTRVFEELEKLHKQIENSSLLNYSFKLRVFTRKYSPVAILKKLIYAGIFAVLGQRLGDGAIYLLQKLAKNTKRSVGDFLARTFGLHAANSFISAFILSSTGIIYFLGDKLLKPFFKVALLFSLSFFIVIVILVFADASWVAKRFDTAANTAPIFCKGCATGGMSMANPSEDPEELTPPIEAEEEEKKEEKEEKKVEEKKELQCPLQPSQNLRCTQGPYRGVTHKRVNAIDIVGPPPVDWHAPSDGIVTRSVWTYENPRLKGQLCGGILHFFSPSENLTYILVHVTPYVQQNQKVKQGQALAKMAYRSDGNVHYKNFRDFPTTCTDGSHFHIEIKETKVYADKYFRDILNCKSLGICP